MDTSPIIQIFRDNREQLLEGPNITLVVVYGGSPIDHSHQLLAANNIVAHDRYRQLSDQASAAYRSHSNTRIVFPIRALEYASPLFATCFQEDSYTLSNEPNTLYMDIYLGPILPGYLMEIVDWLCSALRQKPWKDFLPTHPPIQDSDKFYWLYIYITMRKLGMNDFAGSVGDPFISNLVQYHHLADELWVLDLLLEHLAADDALLHIVAERYVHLEGNGISELTQENWITIFQNYPHFGLMMNKMHRFPDEVYDAVGRSMERLDIDDGTNKDREMAEMEL